MGEEIRKENVTPRGTPASTNPINKGTAEHEQNGVTTPSMAARILPINSFLWDKIRFVFSGGKKLLIIDTAKIITESKRNILMVSYIKNSIASAK
jgi:hypothetical protein